MMKDLDSITCIKDLKKLAKKRTPKMFFDYVESGSWTESTFRANCEDFNKIKFKQRVAVDISNRDTSVEIFGSRLKMPCAIAPVGLQGMQHPDGEILAAKAAENFGIPYTLSTMSICSIEDVAMKTSNPFWFQLYVMKDHSFSKNLIKRAKDVGCSALILTVDLQILGQRHKDIKNGLSTPPKLTIKNILDLIKYPKWCFNMMSTPRRTFRNIVGHVEGVSDVTKLSAWVSEQFDPKLSWEDVSRIRDWWGGKFIIKGILEPEDALNALMNQKVVLLVGGIGNPLFTTDSTASIRANELEVDFMLKATNVNGVYDTDPKENPKAKKFENLTFDDAINQNLQVMDQTALCFCRDNNLQVRVFNADEKDGFEKAISGEEIGTLLKN